VGVTGGLGSGKTTVCKILESLGIPIYYADNRSKWLLNNDQKLKDRIVSLFGAESYIDDKLNSKYIAGIVFSNNELLEKLNEISHPAVKKDFEGWVSRNPGASVLCKEAALLIESGSYKELDHLILVSAPQNVRVRRVLQRDPHRSEEEILGIMKKQQSDEEKRKVSDLEIINDGGNSLIDQLLSLHIFQ